MNLPIHYFIQTYSDILMIIVFSTDKTIILILLCSETINCNLLIRNDKSKILLT